MTITPGDYKTRDGRKATVLAIIPPELGSDQPVLGYFMESGFAEEATWTINGFYVDAIRQDEIDLIEPWLDLVPWDWSSTCPWFNYLAMDKSGDWHLYEVEPSLCDDSWFSDKWVTVPDAYKPKWTGHYSKSLLSRNAK